MPRSPGRTGHAFRQARAWVLENYTHCWWCGKAVDKTLSGRDRMGPSVEHLDPLSLGGDPLNRERMRLAHLGCNSRRGNGTRTRPTRRSRDW